MSEIKYEITCERSSYPKLYLLNLPLRGKLYISSSPFANCQTYTIGSFCILLTMSDNDIKEILKAVIKKIEKKQILVDIESMYHSKLESIINKEAITLKAPYTSSNGSAMVYYLIDTTKLNF